MFTAVDWKLLVSPSFAKKIHISPPAPMISLMSKGLIEVIKGSGSLGLGCVAVVEPVVRAKIAVMGSLGSCGCQRTLLLSFKKMKKTNEFLD